MMDHLVLFVRDGGEIEQLLDPTVRAIGSLAPVVPDGDGWNGRRMDWTTVPADGWRIVPFVRRRIQPASRSPYRKY